MPAAAPPACGLNVNQHRPPGQRRQSSARAGKHKLLAGAT